MYFLVLFVGVFLFLSFVAWRSPWPVYAGHPRTRPQGGGQPDAAPRQAGNSFESLLKAERKEDMPCLTPIDCVQSGKCAGHCGCH